MKTVRSLIAAGGLFLAILALGAAGAKGQAISSIRFDGKFTLPFVAQWGTMTLPPGDYTLQYGTKETGRQLVEVRGTTKGSVYGLIQVRSDSDTSVTRNEIVCVREGSVLFVRALEMPAIGQSVNFFLSPSSRLMAHNAKHGGYAQLAEASVLIQRIPVTLKAK